jgi:CRP-like cAMP-binding protein
MSVKRISDPLRASALGDRVPRRELQALERLGTMLVLRRETTLIRQDSVGAEFFVLIDGEFTVERNGSVVADLRGGDFVGEMALLDATPRNASVTASKNSTVFAFNRREFRALLEHCPELGKRITTTANWRKPSKSLVASTGTAPV